MVAGTAGEMALSKCLTLCEGSSFVYLCTESVKRSFWWKNTYYLEYLTVKNENYLPAANYLIQELLWQTAIILFQRTDEAILLVCGALLNRKNIISRNFKRLKYDLGRRNVIARHGVVYRHYKDNPAKWLYNDVARYRQWNKQKMSPKAQRKIQTWGNRILLMCRSLAIIPKYKGMQSLIKV